MWKKPLITTSKSRKNNYKKFSEKELLKINGGSSVAKATPGIAPIDNKPIDISVDSSIKITIDKLL